MSPRLVTTEPETRDGKKEQSAPEPLESSNEDSLSDDEPMMDMLQNDRPKQSAAPSKPFANGRKDH